MADRANDFTAVVTSALLFWLRHKRQAAWLVGMMGLAGGVGLGTSALIRAVLWQPQPVTHEEQLFSVRVEVEPGSEGDGSIYAEEYLEWTRRQRTFTAMGSYQWEWPTDLHIGGRLERVETVRVTPTLLPTMGVTPLLGRFFSETDVVPFRDDTVVLTYDGWKRLFGGDPDVVGREIHIALTGENPHRARVIGVAPANLEIQRFATTAVDLLQPIPEGKPGPAFGPRAMNGRYIVGRLADPVDRARAEAQLTDLIRDVGRVVPARPRRVGASLVPLRDELYGQNVRLAGAFGLCAGLLLVVALANSTGLLLALTTRRRHERAIRLALGMSTGSGLRQIVAESAVIVAMSSLGAAFVANWLTHTVVALGPPTVRGLRTTHLGFPELLLLLALSALTMAIYVVVVMTEGRSDQWTDVLRSTSTSTMSKWHLRVRKSLLGAQVALVVVLLIGAALVTLAMWRLVSQPLGFNPDRILTAEVWPTATTRAPSTYWRFVSELRAAAGSIPGSTGTAVMIDAPLGATFSQVGEIDGRRAVIDVQLVTDGYFETLEVGLVAGRDLQTPDVLAGRVALVSQSFALRHFGAPGAALGKLVQLGSRQAAAPLEIIGVAADIHESRLDSPPGDFVYAPLSPSRLKASRLVLIAKMSDDSATTSRALAEAVQRLDPNMFVRVSRLRDRFAEQAEGARLQSLMLVSLALFTLLLACAGIYAVVSQLTIDRSRELAVRAALGAPASLLLSGIASHAIWPVLAGTLAGVVVAYEATGVLSAYVFRTSVHDPVAWTTAIAAVLVTAGVAAVMPARHAAAIPPSNALRAE